MAGHSKWHNIQHRKNAQDAKRGKIFTKLIREITVAAKLGGGDPDANPRLRAAIDKALGGNMTKDTIQRAVKRGAGGGEGTDMVELRYEGYGPKSIAVIVECLTDNKNRTVAEVRHAFTKCGGNLGTDGSVSYLFTKTGVITYAPGCDEDKIMEAALEAGAEDVQTNDDGSIDVTTLPDDMLNVKQALIDAGLEPDQSDITMLASTQVDITDDKSTEKVIKFIDMLEDCDDVQNVYTNANL
ncbi:MAG: YebC/PmpR family DNA-binding transcriptional regulator [Gammaproteobacteria bacterium]|nr:YebC/PmpR family DNA-binding transcriptional regulator [Gammaproteobacteria bacterium]MCH9743962.1 YebC/PmpR family DNA-binding transcriptional regulator [Gammaproteobacteria bacterium]